MNYTKREGTFLSNDGKNQVKYYIYVPTTQPRGMFQISHGMCEYIERYEPFIDYMTEKGILVFGNDHLGHKGSVADKADLGYMQFEGGWKCMYEDVHTLSKLVKKEFPGLKLFLFGHSMGSFVARAALANFQTEYDGAIICGTSGTNPMANMGLGLIKFLKVFKGERAKSKLVTKMSFGHYNSRYENVVTGYEWLSRDPKVAEEFLKDEYCAFTFSLAGYYNLISMLSYVTTDNWYNLISENFPLFLVSGDMDPVGDWGKGIKEVDEKLRRKDRKDYQMKLYPDMRHEILNEIGKEEPYADIYNWVNNRL